MSFDANTNSYTLIGNVPTAVEQISAEKASVEIFPNPFTNSATLDVSLPENIHSATLIVSDVTGKVVKQVAVVAAQTTIDRNGLSRGIYLYNLLGDGNSIAKGKIVLQ